MNFYTKTRPALFRRRVYLGRGQGFQSLPYHLLVHNFRFMISSLWASVYSPVKWGGNTYHWVTVDVR